MAAMEIVSAVAVFSVYMFFSVCVGSIVWWKLKIKTEIQKTLRKLIESDREIDPDVIEAIRNDRAIGDSNQIRKRAKTNKYWGYFLVSLGVVLAALVILFAVTTEVDAQQTREGIGAAILFLVCPGLFRLAQAFILMKVHEEEA